MASKGGFLRKSFLHKDLPRGTGKEGNGIVTGPLAFIAWALRVKRERKIMKWQGFTQIAEKTNNRIHRYYSVIFITILKISFIIKASKETAQKNWKEKNTKDISTLLNPNCKDILTMYYLEILEADLPLKF